MQLEGEILIWPPLVTVAKRGKRVALCVIPRDETWGILINALLQKISYIAHVAYLKGNLSGQLALDREVELLDPGILDMRVEEVEERW